MVNKVLCDLVSEGKLQCCLCLGIFVCVVEEKVELFLLDICNIVDEIFSCGKQYYNKVVEQCVLSVDEVVVIKFGVMVGSLVFYSEIIYYVNDILM